MSATRAALALSGCAVALCCMARDPSTDTPDYTHGTWLVLLGTGTPNADPDRAGPAAAVVGQ